MLGRTPNKQEKIWLETVASVGCVVCIEHFGRDLDFGTGCCEIHHIDGSVKPDAHLLTIGLCAKHHRIADSRKNKQWYSLHGDGKAAFVERYADEDDLWNAQYRLNAIFRRSMVGG